MINVLIVDPQKSVRSKLEWLVKSTPDFRLVGSAEDGFSAIAKARTLQPDIVLLNIEMPQLDGLITAKIILEENTDTEILIFSSHESEEYIAKSLAVGAKGYLLKKTSVAELQQAIRFVAAGYIHIGAGFFRSIPVLKKPNSPNVTIPTSAVA